MEDKKLHEDFDEMLSESLFTGDLLQSSEMLNEEDEQEHRKFKLLNEQDVSTLSIDATFFKALVAKHNNANDPTTIENIQSTSGINIFPRRLASIAIIDEDFEWVEKTANSITIKGRTGLTNLDVVTYYEDPRIDTFTDRKSIKPEDYMK